MRAFLIGYGGERWELPTALGWRFQYGCGEPCDSFEGTWSWGDGPDPRLSDAVEFWAEEGGETVFHGVVDEYECGWDGGGGRLTLAGRGMAALLLDNEAEPADYQIAAVEDILRRHVHPYGIQVLGGGDVPAAEHFSVESGSSEWQVLRAFLRRQGGPEPRFDRAGRLLLSGADGRLLRLDDGAAVTEAALRARRYGVFSEVLVRSRATGETVRAVNEAFQGRGGRCRRVSTMPGQAGTAELLRSGRYQLEQSARGRTRLTLRLAGAFLAFPGDRVELDRARPRLTGVWRVEEAESGLDQTGTYTRLTLGK